MPTRVFLFGRERQRSIVLQSLLPQDEGFVLVGGTDKEADVLSAVNHMHVDVVLLYVDGSASAYRVAQQIYLLRPSCVPIAIVQTGLMQDEMSNILRSGLHYVFEESTPRDRLANEIRNACTVESNRMAALTGLSSAVVDTKVLTFFGPKGGVGKTTFLTGVAVELARQGKKVAILDLDLQFGDVATYFGLEVRTTLAELLQDQPNPTIDSIRQYLSIHDTGINVLCAPFSPEYAEKIGSTQIERLIGAMRGYYDCVLIDTSAAFDEILLTCCEQSTDVLLAVRPDIATLKHAKKTISMLGSLGQGEKIRLALIGAEKDARIKPHDVMRVLGLEIWIQVPFDRKAVCAAVNQGVPVPLFNPRSDVTKSMTYAAVQLYGVGIPAHARKLPKIGRKK